MTALFFFPFLFPFSLLFMHFPMIWDHLASPYMSPRRLEGGVSPRLIALKSMAHKKSELNRVGEDEHVARHNNVRDFDESQHANRVHGGGVRRTKLYELLGSMDTDTCISIQQIRIHRYIILKDLSMIHKAIKVSKKSKSDHFF
jgi:hypothetical protein